MKKQKNNSSFIKALLVISILLLTNFGVAAGIQSFQPPIMLDQIFALAPGLEAHILIIPVIILVWVLIRMQIRNNNDQKKFLEETIKLRTQQYKSELERAEKSEKHKEEFLAHMSHEMRTPMNAVVGMTNLLLQTDLNPHQQKYLKIVKESSMNLLKMINDILDLSKIEANKIEFEKIPFKLRDVIKNVNDILSLKAEEKNIQLHFEMDALLPSTLIGDSSRLYQILVNLICNAIKFTENGEVLVTMNAKHISSKNIFIVFKVIDTGIGIQKNQLENIFESFKQAGCDISRKYGGTGLGLSICKKLIEHQGGTISVKSEEGKGSEFEFQLEFGMKEQELAINKSLNPVENLAIGDLNILLVEDNPFNQAVATDTLHNFNEKINVDIAANGKIALDKISNNEYDVVLMDVQMPVMDGIETTGHIRNNTVLKKKNVPIIALTANANFNEAEKCRKAGMNDFVTKPFEPLDLLLKILKVRKENALKFT